MVRPCRPANRIVRIEIHTLKPLLLRQALQSVIVDQHICTPALQLISRDGLLDGLYGGFDDSSKAFFVDRALDGDVRKVVTGQAWRLVVAVEFAVGAHLLRGADDLGNAAYDNLREELTE